ncbi:protein arginine kinase [Prosthecobacter algae]|uniref:Protein-arginine kinase n=1 Tax=Prosthecobacter algae TaxID=1144682 RepID=A0ABP9P0S4_9BACT
MRFTTLIKHPADWMKGSGPHSDVVMTSRVRLARNLRGFSFPGYSAERQRVELLELARPCVESLPEMTDGYSEEYTGLTKIRKQVLVERHLVSREHAARAAGCAVVVDRKQSLSIMINEEDHFRIQGIRAGLNLRSAYALVDKADTALESMLPYAYDDRLGYLTACPTNLGTGMRASVMLHLPALVLSDQINPVIKAVGKIGLAVRGLYGEGTEALGNLFQISNQHTLGEKEGEIIAQIEKVIERVVSSEMNARQKLLEDNPTMLHDQVGRAFAILRYAHILTSKEALNLLSLLRLGADMDLIPNCDRSLLDMLLLEIQPAHLQLSAERELSPEERDARRAEITRARLQMLTGPSNVSTSNSTSEEKPSGSNDE